jgi:hypothetical protein
MPSSDQLALLLVLALLVSFVGIGVAVEVEKRRPSSYTRSAEYLASMEAWRGMPAAAQEAADNAALELGAQAEIDARQDAEEAARFLADQARANVLYHP